MLGCEVHAGLCQECNCRFEVWGCSWHEPPAPGAQRAGCARANHLLPYVLPVR